MGLCPIFLLRVMTDKLQTDAFGVPFEIFIGLNRNINDLKFFKFKERLLFKASEKHKRIVLVNEAYTSQTCCFCGSMYKPGCSKIYECKSCNKRIDRDINASKNILMKGILSL